MSTPAVSIPVKKVSAWVAETNPKFAREWLASLPMADSAEAGREIYQALYTLNRQDLDAHDRFELMELYRGPVSVVINSLQPHFTRLSLPLSPKKRQLAEFIRQLHMEMANGYKLCITELEKTWKPWGKKQLLVTSLERALCYLGNVLLRSYQVYVPYPPGTWKEIHELYRYAETNDRHKEPIAVSEEDDANQTSIQQRYLQILLLGLCSPYQLPQGQCLQISQFLEKWANKSLLQTDLNITNPVGHFLVDLTTDTPPIPFPRDVKLQADSRLRILNAIELVRMVHSFVNHIRKGRPAQSLQMGLDCLDSACLDLLQRMVRSWALVARRRHARIKRNSSVFLCVGISALHFFSSGQKPFAVPAPADVPNEREEGANLASHLRQVVKESQEEEYDETYIALDGSDSSDETEKQRSKNSFPDLAKLSSTEIFHVDRWRVRDAGPEGMLLSRSGETTTSVRVGDVLGIQHMNDVGNWGVAVVRWIKSPGPASLEMGVEMLAPSSVPVAIKPVAVRKDESSRYTQALRLPAMEAIHRPETLLISSGLYQPEHDYSILEEEAPPRMIRSLKLVQRNGSFEQIVFVDVQHD